MTIVKQRAVTEKGHQKNLRGYINDDRKVLLRDSQNMDGCTDIKRWASHMEATRRRLGHDKASRRVRDKKTGEMKEARNTTMYHQILGFNPDECDINGGKLTPEECMRYAKEYAATYYPNQEVVFALHDEYCKEDKTHRYAVHMVINRSDLSTGKRLNEGRGETAKVRRASRIRKMDKSWNLRQVVEGERNSDVHGKQPSKIEKFIAARGGLAYKTNLRELCRLAAQKAENIYAYRELLESWGVDTQFRRGRMYVTDLDNARYSFSVVKLDADLSQAALERGFRENAAESIKSEGREIRMERQDAQAERGRIADMKQEYLAEIETAYREYRKTAHSLEGTELQAFPKMKLKRPPMEIATDPEVKKTVLAYWRGADELRAEMATGVPYTRKDGGSASGSSSQGNRMTPDVERGQSMQKEQKGKDR